MRETLIAAVLIVAVVVGGVLALAARDDAGRFQMQAGFNGAAVWLLDNATGRVTLCGTDGNNLVRVMDGRGEAPGCSPWSAE